MSSDGRSTSNKVGVSTTAGVGAGTITTLASGDIILGGAIAIFIFLMFIVALAISGR